MHSSDITHKLRRLNDEKDRINAYFNRMKNDFRMDDHMWIGVACDKYHSNCENTIDKHKSKLLNRLSDLENELYRYKRTLEIEEEERAERMRLSRLEALKVE